MKLLLTSLFLSVSFCGSLAYANEKMINKTLDAFHQAAADAKFDAYFSLLSDDAIFLGTDSSERWTKQQFKTFVRPYFSQGKGWLYVPTVRNLSFIPNSDVVYFDEILMNESYGETRGSGVMIETERGWKIAQYNLSIPMPNAIAKELVERIKHYQNAQISLKEKNKSNE